MSLKYGCIQPGNGFAISEGHFRLPEYILGVCLDYLLLAT